MPAQKKSRIQDGTLSFSYLKDGADSPKDYTVIVEEVDHRGGFMIALNENSEYRRFRFDRIREIYPNE